MAMGSSESFHNEKLIDAYADLQIYIIRKPVTQWSIWLVYRYILYMQGCMSQHIVLMHG